MGKIENIVKASSRKEFIKNCILASVQVTGMLAVAVVAPNVLTTLDKLGLLPRDGKYAIKRSLGRLLDSGHIRFESRDGKKFFVLTDKGQARLLRLQTKHFQLPKPKYWDKKFRILIFDVQEQNRNKRDRFRVLLQQIGFKKIQQSVWAYPYDCEDTIQLLKTDLGVGKNVIYLVTGDIEGREKIAKMFGLKL